MDKTIETVCVQIIASVGSAKSKYIEAIKAAKQSHVEKAKELIDSANQDMSLAQTAHFELITKEANGQNVPINMLLMHAEDQMNSAETFGII